MNKNSLIISIVTVLLMGLIVTGGTFAYFQWSSGLADRTNVNVTIEAGQIAMHIEPENTVYTDLRPVADCNNALAYVDTLATLINNTGAMAIPSFKLSAKVTKNGTEELTSEALSHIHYSVVLLETNSKTGAKGTNTLNGGSCSNPANFSLTNENLYFNGITTGNATGTFSTVSTEGEWTDLPSTSTEYLPRQFNTISVTPYGVTFLGLPHTTSYQWLRVYVWMDEDYTYTNIGNVVSDPLQNAKIEVTWSTNSMIEQVSSIALGEEEDSWNIKPAGLYKTDGTFISWDTLVTNGDITVENGVITDSNDYFDDIDGTLEGELVIAKGITSIGRNAFSMTANLTSVILSDSVTSIGDSAFDSSGLKSIVIPKSVISTGEWAFSADITDVYYEGTKDEWYNINFDGPQQSDSAKLHYNYDPVTGSSDLLLPTGLYDAEGYLALSWSDLVGSGWVTIENGVITDSNIDIFGPKLIIPDTITGIGADAFSGYKLTTIVISKSVTSIGSGAFGDTSLTDVYYEGTEEEWNAINIDANGNTLLINATKHYNYKVY